MGKGGPSERNRPFCRSSLLGLSKIEIRVQDGEDGL